MAKSPTLVKVLSTGIYHRETQKGDPTKIEEINKQYDLGYVLTQMKQFAQSVIDAYEDRPPDYEEWKRWSEVYKKDKEAAKQLKPKTPHRVGFSRTPSKTAGIPENVERQRHDAQWLRAYAELVSQALEKGNIQKAALYGYFVGRYGERLLVRQEEHLALAELKQIAARSKGGKARAIPQSTVDSWTALAATLRLETPDISDLSIAEIISRELGGKVETIRKKI